MKKLLHRWFIEAMSFMALGLFGTLIIGLIINTIASYIPSLSGLSLIGDTAQSLTGAAIGVAIAYGLKSPPLVIFSVLAVSQYAYDLGGAAASFIVSLIVIEVARLYQQKTKLDIIVSPFLTLVIGLLLAGLIGEAVGGVMTGLGDVIMFATEQRPFMMGILVSVVFGITLTAPLSSAALSLMLDLNGVAAGAGMGTSGFVGQIMAIETMGLSTSTVIMVLVFHIVLPLIVTLIFYKLFSLYGFIKQGDQVISLGK